MSLLSVIPGPATDADTATTVKASFLDLPTELRCIVYRHYLVGDCRIEIQTDDDGKLKMKWNCKPKIQPAVIFANKEIHAEATSILYGANDFSLQTIHDFNTFMTRINKSSIQHLRRIGYQDLGNKDIVRDALLSLKTAKNLIKLDITNEMTGDCGWYCTMSAKQLVRMLSPLFEALHESRKEYREDKVGPISEILSIHAPKSSPWMWNRRKFFSKEEAEDKAKEVEKEVKELLEAKFG